ncbi:putative Protein ULTRAPETALA1 [Corchorus olitorius]|uniref:Uncharacterized protein n=1 Tax=Corchorus olitorius TaxID=93759 RepID=A0A1R3G0C7_9ROSI|nr:putative Protein ULTRAPETALA1 [Corchorus olitorius]
MEGIGLSIKDASQCFIPSALEKRTYWDCRAPQDVVVESTSIRITAIHNSDGSSTKQCKHVFHRDEYDEFTTYSDSKIERSRFLLLTTEECKIYNDAV